MKHKILFFLSILLYRLLLDYNYINIVSPRHSYAGFTFDAVETEAVYLSWVMLGVISVQVYQFFKRNYYFTLCFALLVFLLRVVPMTSFIACHNHPFEYIITQMVFYVLLFLLLYIIHFKGIYRFQAGETLVNIIVIAMCLNILFISGYYSNFRVHLSFEDVYDLRFEARTYNIWTPLKYIWTASNNILPVMIIYYFEKNKRYFVFFIIFICLLNFGINGLKSTVFKVALCLLVYKFYRDAFLKYLALVLSGICLISIIELVVYNDYVISDMIVRRVFYMPARLDFCYYDYITHHSPIFFDSDLANKLPYAIGSEYMDDGVNANNGMFSDAFAKFGYGGVFLYPFLYTLFVAFSDKAMRLSERSLQFYVAFVVASTFYSSSFTTSLLTHGVVLTVLMVMIVSKDKSFFKRKLPNKQ